MSRSKQSSEVVYVVLESCMRPGGAWAKSVGQFASQEEAVQFARDRGFEGPGAGIVTQKTVSVTRRERRGTEFKRKTVFTRDVSAGYCFCY